MGFETSIDVCHQAIDHLSSNQTFENRLLYAFEEMRTTSLDEHNDTSEEIYNEWITLRDQYDNNSKLDINELEKIRKKLLDIIFEWIEYNTITIHSNNITEE